MRQEEFIEVLGEKGYSYEIEGDKIVVTHNNLVDLDSLDTLPPGVEFNNNGHVLLGSLETLNPGVEFNNRRWNVLLRSLIGGWFEDWYGNIEGIDNKRLLNHMINKGVFI